MRKRLLIIGAGGYGRELVSLIETSRLGASKWTVSGFLDDNPNALNGYPCRYRVLGRPLTHTPQRDEVFACAISDPKTKLTLCRALKVGGAEFVDIIHPTVSIGVDSIIGQGLIAGPYCAISTNVRIGEFVTINSFAGVGHDACLHDGVTLSAHCDVTGGAVLGEGVLFGTHAAVLPRLRVGDYATVGAGSVAMRDVAPGTTVAGLPARRIDPH